MTNRSPRVLFVIHQIGSGADGGIRSVSEMIRAVPDLPKTVVTNIDSPITDALRHIAPVEIWPMTEPTYRGEGRSFAFRIAQLKGRLINNVRAWRMVRNGVTVLHANDQRAFWNTAAGARLGGGKLIFNVRDTMRAGGRLVPWRRALDLCDRFLVLSQEMVASWRADLRPASLRPANRAKFAYLYSIVDRSRYFPIGSDRRAALRDGFGMEPDRAAIVYVGRFDDKKAQLDFIEHAMPRLKQLRPDAVTWFVGDFDPRADAYAAACAAAVERLGLTEQVRFVGYSPDTADWYRAADVVVLASRREGLPRCMIESLACGAAFVSFDVCSTREILEGQDCGLVVPQGDYGGLAKAVGTMLDEDVLRQQCQMKGPEIVSRLFDEKTNGSLYQKLIASLLENGHG